MLQLIHYDKPIINMFNCQLRKKKKIRNPKTELNKFFYVIPN